jgi:hypothetical protein
MSVASASFSISSSRAVSSSFATTASFASNGGVTQIVAGTNISISPTNGLGAITINSTGGGGSPFPFTGSAIITGSLVVTGSTISTLGFTGSLQGTSSWASNAVTASYAVSASFASTASFATTASYSETSALTNNAYFAQGILNATQAIPNSLDTIIQFVDQFDPPGWYDPGTYKFLPNIAGYYTVSLGVTLENTFNNTGYVQIQILKNGSTREMQCRQPLNNTSDSSLFGSKIIYLDGSTDYLEFIVYQSSAGTFNILTGPGAQSPETWFSATYMTM